MSDGKPRFGRYELVSELGRGGMGIVYRARDTVLGRQCAIKTLPPKKLKEELIERFFREARAVALLQSPYIIQIFDIGEHNDGQNIYYYIVMEFVEGATLGEVFETPPQDLTEVRHRLDVLEQVLEAMEYAHGQGVVHRDLKPDNIMVTPSHRVKVMDFGLALIAGSHSLTGINQVMGTVAYFSPEQAKASPNVDHRTDIYSLGVIMFELLTGELPFVAEHPLDMMRQVVGSAPRKPSSLNPLVSPELEAVCLKCLEKDPALRYRTVSDFLKALKGTANSKTARPIPVADVPEAPPAEPAELPAPPAAPTREPSGTRQPSLPPTSALTALNAPESKNATRLDSTPAGENPAPSSAAEALATAYDLPLDEVPPQIEEATPGENSPRPGSGARLHSLHPAMASTSWQHEVHSQKSDEPEEELSPLPPKPRPHPSSGPSVFCQCGGENPPGVDTCRECGEEIKPSIYIVRREADSYYKSGMQALSRGHWSEARDEFMRALEQNREFGEAYLELGRVQLSLAEFEGAHKNLESALEFLPSRYEPLLALADLYQQVEQPKDVVACLQDILEERPRDTAIRCRLALLYCQLGELDKALGTYRVALKYDADHLGANRQLGLLLAAEGREDEAVLYLEKVSQLDPGDGHVLGILGNLYAKAGHLRRAEDAFVRALEKRHDDPDLRVELSQLYRQQGRVDKASSQLRKTLRAEEGHLAASGLMAQMLLEQGQFDHALELLKRAVRYHPEDDSLHRQMGEVYLAQGRLDGALESFEKVVELRPDCAEMRNQLGRVYLKKNYDDKSVEEYRAAVSLDALNPDYREDLGMAYYVSGKLDLAASELHKATKINSKNPDYFRALGFIYRELNIPKQAVEHFKWALHLEPNHARTRGALAQALMTQGLVNQAVDQFKAALSLDPSLVLLHLSLARALSAAGRHQEAIAAFREFGASVEHAQQTQLASRAFLEMGHTLLHSGDIGQAAEIFQAALAHPEEEASARIGLAQVSLARSDLKTASNHLKRALETEPLNAEVWQVWSSVAAEQGDWKEAINRMERAVSLGPNREDLWIQLGRCFRKAGRIRDADETFRKGAEKFPQSEARFSWLRGRLAVRMKDWSSAYQHLNHSLRLAPGSWRVHEDMALACIGLQNWRMASQHVNQAAELAPANKRDSILQLHSRIPA